MHNILCGNVCLPTGVPEAAFRRFHCPDASAWRGSGFSGPTGPFVAKTDPLGDPWVNPSAHLQRVLSHSHPSEPLAHKLY